jgi:hypothetical protein
VRDWCVSESTTRSIEFRGFRRERRERAGFTVSNILGTGPLTTFSHAENMVEHRSETPHALYCRPWNRNPPFTRVPVRTGRIGPNLEFLESSLRLVQHAQFSTFAVQNPRTCHCWIAHLPTLDPNHVGNHRGAIASNYRPRPPPTCEKFPFPMAQPGALEVDPEGVFPSFFFLFSCTSHAIKSTRDETGLIVTYGMLRQVTVA